jgi:hypothetical protein
MNPLRDRAVFFEPQPTSVIRAPIPFNPLLRRVMRVPQDCDIAD